MNSSELSDSFGKPPDVPLQREDLQTALRHLRRRDAVLRSVIAAVGPCTLRLERDRFRMLVRSIVSQQISGKAARSISLRLEQLLAPAKVSAEALADQPLELLRRAGLSAQKASYLHDLSAKVGSGEVQLRRVGRMTDEDVIAELTQVRGIGVWTAQMFLMFSLGRLDVFPHDDLGIRSALKRLYGLGELPDRELSHRIAAPWRPYATIASWYCWRSHEVERLELPLSTEFRR
jgi:DNA-3-methyladenine glycosylase II